MQLLIELAIPNLLEDVRVLHFVLLRVSVIFYDRGVSIDMHQSCINHLSTRVPHVVKISIPT